MERNANQGTEKDVDHEMGSSDLQTWKLKFLLQQVLKSIQYVHPPYHQQLSLVLPLHGQQKPQNLSSKQDEVLAN